MVKQVQHLLTSLFHHAFLRYPQLPVTSVWICEAQGMRERTTWFSFKGFKGENTPNSLVCPLQSAQKHLKSILVTAIAHKIPVLAQVVVHNWLVLPKQTTLKNRSLFSANFMSQMRLSLQQQAEKNNTQQFANLLTSNIAPSHITIS